MVRDLQEAVARYEIWTTCEYDVMELWLEPAVKAVLYAVVLLTIGACATRWFLLPRIEGPLSPSVRDACEDWLARMLLSSAAAVFATLLLRAVAHSVTVFGPSEALSWDSLRTVVVTSRWGGGWRAQAAASLLVLIAALSIRLHRRMGWIFSAVCVSALVGSLPLLGHAAGHLFPTLLHGVHVLAAGLWMGTLVIAATVPTVVAGVPLKPRLLRAFAPVAATGATALLVSGAIATWTYLGPLANLWHTDYGRLLALKLALVAGVACCGYANWRQLHRRADWRASWAIVAAEICLAAAVVVVTAWLSETGHPP